MKVSQLIHAMEKDDVIVIDHFDKPIDSMTLYEGPVRGIKRDDPINKMHSDSVCASDDKILLLVTNQKKDRRRGVEEVTP